MATPIGTFGGVNIENTNRGFQLPGTTGSPSQAAHATITVAGLQGAVALLLRAGVSFPVVVNELFNIAADVINDARENYVPIDTGLLWKSGDVHTPEFHGKTAMITFGFGKGVFNKYGSAYAIPVHEIPAPPASSVGGRSARHYRGEWRYLLTPFLMIEDDIPNRLMNAVVAHLKP